MSDDVILVLNAGSSSIKFRVFAFREESLVLILYGQVEGVSTSPCFVAKSPEGVTIGEKAWGDGFKLGHEGAIDHLRVFLRERYTDARLVGVGHRVAHGGLKYFQPVRVDERVLAQLEQLVPLVPLHHPRTRLS